MCHLNAEPDVIGETVSHYRITEKLGGGAMGVVYRAEDLKLRRIVALKFLPHDLTRDEDAKRRFVYEAQAASALDHPNICTIHEIDETPDGQLFLCMAHYEGETLRERIERGPAPLQEAIDFAQGIAEGLAKAHAQGIVHRDIKPANIIVTRDGAVKILDFGLAKLAGRTKVTRTGMTVGTVSYMSPEQARGEEVDGRSDLFSLGAVFYEMLTGSPPFRGDHEAVVLYGLIHTDPKPLSDCRPELPPELQHIVDRALAKEVGIRYQNAAEFLEDLRAVAARRPLSKAASRPGRRPRRMRSRLRFAVSLVVVGMLLAAMVWRFVPRVIQPVSADDIALAVVDFLGSSEASDPVLSAGITNLVRVGLVESSPIRVVSPSYLYELRRRLFGAERGPIGEDQALELARKSGAAMLLSAQIDELAGHKYVTWHLVETASGRSLAAKRAEESSPTSLADRIVADVLPILCQESGSDLPPPPPSVAAITTGSSEAYQHYVAGLMAFKEGSLQEGVHELEKAVEIDSTFALASFDLARVYFSSRGFQDERAARAHADRAWAHRSKLGVKNRLQLEAHRANVEYRVTDAKATYSEIIDRWPDDREVLHDFASLLHLRWYFREGVDLLERAVELYPDDIELLTPYVSCLNEVGRHGDAMNVIERLVDEEPQNPEFRSDLGYQYLKMGLPDSAQTTFERALAMRPDYFYAQRGLFSCDAARGDLPEAIRKAERMLERPDLLPEQRMQLITANAFYPGTALLYAESGRFEKALAAFEEAGQFGLETVQRNNLRRLLLLMGRPEEVLRLTKGPHAAATKRGRLNDVQFAALALAELDSIGAATSMVNELLEAEKEWGGFAVFAARQALVEIALAEGNPKRALDILREMRRDGVGMGNWGGLFDIECRQAEARALALARRPKDAVRSLKELLRVYGYHALGYYELGRACEAAGGRRDAEAALTRFVDMWAGADEGLGYFGDARDRLARLKRKS